MGKVQFILIAVFAVSVVSGREEFHGHIGRIHGEVRSLDERQYQNCTDNYLNQTFVQGEFQQINHGCILSCQYTPNNEGRVSGYIQKQPDFSPCSTDAQCLNGKCFQNDCVEKCKTFAGTSGVTLTNIRVDKFTETVYCESYNRIINGEGFSLGDQCGTESQLDFYGAYNYGENSNDDGISEVSFSNVVQPIDICKAKYGDSASARKWSNGCYFRCVINDKVQVERYIQPNGAQCIDNYQCLSSKCQKNICIGKCQLTAANDTLADVIQEDETTDKVDCYFKGQATLVITKLDSPLKCEASYTTEEGADGRGEPIDGRTVSFGNIGGSSNHGWSDNTVISGNHDINSLNNNNNSNFSNFSSSFTNGR